MMQFNNFTSTFPATGSYVKNEYHRMSWTISRRMDWAANKQQQLQQWLEEHQPLVSCAVSIRLGLLSVMAVIVLLATTSL